MSNLSALHPSLPILIGASMMLSLAMGLRQSPYTSLSQQGLRSDGDRIGL
jgi:hypothetical protein